MSFVRIESGSFMMGRDSRPLPEDLTDREWQRDGDFSEQPAHKVTSGAPFYIGIYQVTNAEYEQFDPAHRELRGKLGYSNADEEAVVFISWHDAVRFCEWLSAKEGLPYRLPTEAEWEYACRAGTTTHFNTGDSLPEEYLKNPGHSWYPDPARARKDGLDIVQLIVGQNPPNDWGLYDMHGNVEEWCSDWYGSYESDDQTDPVGRVDGDFKVTRGGSHSTKPYYLRSACRMGTLPDERTWVIGFRVVIGPFPQTEPLPVPEAPLHQINVSQDVPADLSDGPDPEKPFFKGPRKFVKIPPDSFGPIFSGHNHAPAITECANGDLYALWYTCVGESGRDHAVAASRLRYGADEWDPADLLWDAPYRNDHNPTVWFDGKETLYHFNGLSVAATWGNLALIVRTSKDNGATWSKARFIDPEHGLRHMPIESVFRTKEGYIILPCDAVTGGNGGTAIWVSRDEGKTWNDPGGTIAGIHAGVTQLEDGRLMALGRGDSIDDRMPMSISSNMGKDWQYSASIFPPIVGGQRLVLRRLNEGPLFCASFAQDMTIADESGEELKASGVFAAISMDDGETWPIRRLVTDDGPERNMEGFDGREFILSKVSSEMSGYMTGCQGVNDVIHLLTSRNHYAFNLAWLKTFPQVVRFS